MKNPRVWLRLSPALMDGLDEIAKKQGFSSRQEVIRVLIREALQKQRGLSVGGS